MGTFYKTGPFFGTKWVLLRTKRVIFGLVFILKWVLQIYYNLLQNGYVLLLPNGLDIFVTKWVLFTKWVIFKVLNGYFLEHNG